MKIEFIGTGAADWWHREKDGKFTPVYENGMLRRFTSTLIDDTILIDGTITVNDSLDKLKGVPVMLYTHSHYDHYDAEFLKAAAPSKVFCHESWSERCGAEGLKFGETREIAGYSVTILPSNHSTDDAAEQTGIYLIEKGDEKLLYSTDGAWITNAAYHIIKKHAPLTCCVFDGTVGDAYPDDWRVFEHNTLPMVRTMRSALLKAGLLREGSKVFVTHLARTLHPSQTELENFEKSQPLPLIIAYDGMVSET